VPKAASPKKNHTLLIVLGIGGAIVLYYLFKPGSASAPGSATGGLLGTAPPLTVGGPGIDTTGATTSTPSLNPTGLLAQIFDLRRFRAAHKSDQAKVDAANSALSPLIQLYKNNHGGNAPPTGKG
jgi:hypothetical protein